MTRFLEFLWAALTVSVFVGATRVLSLEQALLVTLIFVFSTAFYIAIFCHWRKISFGALLRNTAEFTLWLTILVMGTHDVTRQAITALFSKTAQVFTLPLLALAAMYIIFDIVAPRKHGKRGSLWDAIVGWGSAHWALWQVIRYFALIEIVSKCTDLLVALHYGDSIIPGASTMLSYGPFLARALAICTPIAVLVVSVRLARQVGILVRVTVNDARFRLGCYLNGVAVSEKTVAVVS